MPGHAQQVCELQIVAWNAARIILVTPQGRQVTVRAPPGHPRFRVLFEFQWQFLVKDLGLQARCELGLEAYTPTWETTRIKHEGRYLPMHRPVATLCPHSSWYNAALNYCTFCLCSLQNKKGDLGPFQGCWFCLDSPAWHHGGCCPHNPQSPNWNGPPHLVLHQRACANRNNIDHC